MSPRKSSTSSGKRPNRPRYLGLEIAGAPSTLSPRGLGALLEERLSAALGAPGLPPRVVRLEGSRALVEVPHGLVGAARSAWNGPASIPGAPRTSIATRRTWGTLRKGKAWLRLARPGPARRSAPRRNEPRPRP